MRAARQLGAVLAATLALAGLAGCGNAAEDRADQVTAAVAALPGVAAVDGAVEDSGAYRLRVTASDGIDDSQVVAVGQTFRDGVDHDDFDDHEVWFSLESTDGRGVVRWVDGLENPSPSLPLWRELTEKLTEDVEFELRVNGDLILGEARTEDAVGAVEELTGLQTEVDDLSWTVIEPGELTVRWSGGELPAQVRDWLPGLVADEDLWSVAHHQGYLVPVKTRAETVVEGQDPETVARRHLDLVASLGVPVLHSEGPTDAPTLEVAVGEGCVPGGSELQQQLNREYGTC